MSSPTNPCPVCGATTYSPLSYGGYRYNGRDMPLVRCHQCDLMYVIHGLTKAQFSQFYADQSYFDSEYAGGVDLDYASNVAELKGKARVVLSRVKRYKPHARLLDIGCAGGYLLEVARDEYGYEPHGVEVSAEMVTQAKARGLDVFLGTISELPVGKPFDIVYMGDVLEHIPDPQYFMSSVERHMAPGSLLVLELPLTYNHTLSGIIIGLANMVRGKFGRTYFLPAQHRHGLENKPPYHVLMFSRRSIKNFFERHHYTIRYLKLFEGKPKPKFAGTLYGKLKVITHILTMYLPQNFLGDRMIVIAEKQ